MLEKKGVKEEVETFGIHSQIFNLWATLYSLKEGGYAIHGHTQFKDGECLVFFCEGGDPAELRRQMLSACRPIAHFYGTDILHQKTAPTDTNRARPGLTAEARLLH